MTIRRPISGLLLLFTILSTFAASAQSDTLAWKRMKHLSKGVNLSSWMAQTGNYSPQVLRATITPADIEHIRQTGFDHIRIPVDPVIFECAGAWEQCGRVQLLDQVISKAISEGLSVILVLYPDQQFMHQLAVGPTGPASLIKLWGLIANHYVTTDPDRLVFETINEVEMTDPYRWAGITERCVDEIRRASPSSTVIVNGPEWADIWDLVQLPVFKEINLIYSFHYYEPHLFTQQGANWGNPMWIAIHNLPFPASRASVDPLIASQQDPSARWEMSKYELEHWDAEHIEAQIDFAVAWAKERKVPLICDEFGVYRPYTSQEDRENWLTATRKALEKNGIGWSAWDYQGGFGVVFKDQGKIRNDDVALRGLGLEK